jgi:site-specific DNA-cytosine methylase
MKRRNLVMLDLFAGLGGASAAMRRRGWTVISVEADPDFGPTIVADLMNWKPARDFPQIDLLWASPPCTEFSRESMPWCRTGREPSVDLVHASLRLVELLKPRYWVLENVKGSIKYINPILGKWSAHIGALFLWGEHPEMVYPKLTGHKQQYDGSKRGTARRSQVPYEISRAFAVAVEQAQGV